MAVMARKVDGWYTTSINDGCLALNKILRISIGGYMDINLIHSGKKFIQKAENKVITVELVKSYLKSESSYDQLETFRFNDDYESLTNKIYNSFIEYPKLQNEIKILSNSIRFDKNYILKSAMKLNGIVNYNKPIDICIGITGFDCAVGAYGNTIYFGLEWFASPKKVGVNVSDYRYEFMLMLNSRVNDFVEETIPHEIVHIMSNKPKNDDFMFRVIEEGRACYVTHLLNPTWPLEKVLPMNINDMELAIKNEMELVNLVSSQLSNDANNTIKNLFSPMGKFMSIQLAGYYLSYKLIEKYFEDIHNIDEKINHIMSFTNGELLYQELLNYNNSKNFD